MSGDLAFGDMSVSDVCFWLQEKGFSDDIVEAFRGEYLCFRGGVGMGEGGEWGAGYLSIFFLSMDCEKIKVV